MQLAFAAFHDMPAAALAARAFVSLAMLFGATLALLRWRGMANRATQTLLALSGAEVVFALISMPLLLALQPHLGSDNPPGSILVLMLVAVFVFFWKLRVSATIWRQALELSVSFAYLLTFALLLCEALLLLVFVPAPVSAAP